MKETQQNHLVLKFIYIFNQCASFETMYMFINESDTK